VLSRGNHSLKINVTDNLGAVTSSTSDFTINSIPTPSIDAVSGNSGNFINSGNMNFSINNGTSLDKDGNVSSYQFRIDGSTWSQAYTSSSNLTTAINQAGNDAKAGAHLLDVKVTDALGDFNIASDNFIINSNQPAISGLDGVSSLNTLFNVTYANETVDTAQAGHLAPYVSISDPNNNISEYAFRVDSNSWNTFSNKADFDFAFNNLNGSGLSIGAHTLEVKVVDDGGPITSKANFSIGTPPAPPNNGSIPVFGSSFDVITVDSSSADATGNIISGSVFLNAKVPTATDTDGTIQSYQYLIKDSSSNIVYSSALFTSAQDTENAINTYNISTLTPGNYSVELIAKDNDGNIAVLGNTKSSFSTSAFTNNYSVVNDIYSSSSGYYWSDGGSYTFDSWGYLKISNADGSVTTNLPLSSLSGAVFGTTYENTFTHNGADWKIKYGWAVNGIFRMEASQISGSEQQFKLNWSGNMGSDGGTQQGTVSKAYNSGSSVLWTHWNNDSSIDGAGDDPQMTYTVVPFDSSFSKAGSNAPFISNYSGDNETGSTVALKSGATMYIQWGYTTVDNVQTWIINDLASAGGSSSSSGSGIVSNFTINSTPTPTIDVITNSFANGSSITTVQNWSTGGINGFGETDTATFGQTFTVPADSNNFNSFTFYLNDYSNPDNVDFRGYVMAWDGSKAIGSVLFESGIFSTKGESGYEKFTLSTGGLNLNAGQQYVAFLNASKEFDGVSGTAEVGMTNNLYSGGNMVFLNHGSNFNSVTSNSWNSWSGNDLAFTMDFAAPGLYDSANNIINPGLPLSFSINSGTSLDADKNVVNFEYRLDNGSWTSFTGTNAQQNFVNSINAISTTSLAAGTHTLDVKLTDSVGGIGTNSNSFVIDNNPTVKLTNFDVVTQNSSSSLASSNTIVQGEKLSATISTNDSSNNVITNYQFAIKNSGGNTVFISQNYSDKFSLQNAINDYDTNQLQAGKYSVEAILQDNLGGRAIPQMPLKDSISYFSINSTPTPLIDAVLNNDTNVINPGQVNFSINAGTSLDSDANASSFAYRLDNGSWLSGYTSPTALTTAINNAANV
jgi:hypothetical protein